MIPSKIHIILRVVVLIAVFFFSSGFTAIVKYCSMSHSSECCCSAWESRSQNNDRSVSGQNPSCFSIKTIGGLSDTRATLNSEHTSKTIAIEMAAVISNTISIPISIQIFLFSYADDIAPPNQEIYILVNSFLI